MLTLPIKRKWFDMILSGEKKEEYREIKPYYTTRFGQLWQGSLIGFDAKRKVMFRNGYSKQSPSFVATVTLDIGEGKTEWGAEKGKDYYVLKIHSVDLFLPAPGKDCKNCTYKECKKLEEINLGNMGTEELKRFQENELYKRRIKCIAKQNDEIKDAN